MASSQTDSIKIIEVSQGILSTYSQELARTLDGNGQLEDPPAQMIFTGTRFADETYGTLRHVLNNDGSDVLCATLVRPVFEMSIRLLWATGEPDGWVRLQTSWATGKDKWIKSAAPYPECKPLADSLRPKVDDVLARRDVHGRDFKNAPDVREMLKKLDEHDAVRGLSTPCDNWSAQYPGVYQLLCGPSHGDMIDIGKLKSGRFEKTVVTAAIAATWTLLRVCSDVMHFDDPEEKIRRTNAVGDEYASLINSCKQGGS